ncbi:hypothetical protein PTKIN_Ptkin18bG0066500 [Pterospermum kingtungense]
MKFNVDGSTLGKPGPAGIGGVLRDHEGNIKIRLLKSVGSADSNLAELLAIKEAFLKVKHWVVTHILREANSLAGSLAKEASNGQVDAVKFVSGSFWLECCFGSDGESFWSDCSFSCVALYVLV